MIKGLKYFIRNFNSKISASLGQVISILIVKFLFCFLNSDKKKKIQSTIVDVLLLVQYNASIRKPYDQTECRLSLYETLLELALKHNLYIPVPLSQSVQIFRSGLDDDSNEVKK